MRIAYFLFLALPLHASGPPPAIEVPLVSVQSEVTPPPEFEIFVENNSWKDLEVINMTTGKKKDTGIDDPHFIRIEGKKVLTDKGSFELKD